MQTPLVIESIDDATATILSRKTAAERLQIAFGMWRSARNMLFAMIRAEHPEWSDQDVSAEVARRFSHGAR